MADREFKIKITTESDSGGARDTARDLENLGQKGKEAHEKVGESAEHSEISHKALRTILQQLGPEFSHLGHLGVVGFANPVTAGVLGLGIALGGLINSLHDSSEEMKKLAAPDPRSLDPTHVNAAKEAWHQYAEELRLTGENMDSVEKATGRYITRLDTALARRKESIGSTQELDTARGAAGSPQDSIQMKLLAGLAADRQKRQAEQDAEQAKIDAKQQEAIDLYKEAGNKKAEAGDIHVASAKDDASTLERLKENSKEDEDTVKSYKEGHSFLGLLGKRLMGLNPFSSSWGMTTQDILEDEDTKAMQAQANLDRAASFQRRGPGRDEMRSRRTGLYKRAADAETNAGEIAYTEVPDMESDLGERRMHDSAMGLQNELKLGLEALQQGQSEAKKLSDSIATSVQANNQIPSTVIQGFKAQIQFNEQLKAYVQQIEQQVGNLRTR